MRYPATITKSGKYVEGFVAYSPTLTPDTDRLWLPKGLRPVMETDKRVGRESSVEDFDGGLWMAAQLDKRSKYLEWLKELIKAGKLSLSALTLPKLTTKNHGIVEQPLVGWDLVPLRSNGPYVVSAAETIKHLEEVPWDVPNKVFEALEVAAEQERRDAEQREAQRPQPPRWEDLSGYR